MKKFYLELQKDCEQTACAAAEILRNLQGKTSIVQMKDAVDLATSADIASETFINSTIRAKYPSHAIHSEEAGDIKGESDEYTWIVDPLDGTKEYVRGLSEYNVLIAVEKGGTLVAGAMYANGPSELYSASRGNGSFLNSKQISVSTEANLPRSLVGFHLPVGATAQEEIDRTLVILRKLIAATYRVRPGWYDANFLCWVGRGALEGHIMPPHIRNKWEDDAPGILLVEEAGGMVTDYSGNALKNDNVGNGVVASNGKIHDQLLEIINNV